MGHPLLAVVPHNLASQASSRWIKEKSHPAFSDGEESNEQKLHCIAEQLFL